MDISDIDLNDEDWFKDFEPRVEEHICSNPPGCGRGFSLTEAKLPESFDVTLCTGYALSCQCGNNEGWILGYPLEEGAPDFVTPLGFQCASCDAVTEILDTAIHGYHAEVAKFEGGPGSCKIRGEGPRTRFPCPKCSQERFTVTVGFLYWDYEICYFEVEDLAEGKEGNGILEHPQDFFNEFVIYAECLNCHTTAQPVGLGKL